MSTDREREALADAMTDALVAATEDQLLTRATMRAISDAAAARLAAGWMPRPEHGSQVEDAMVGRLNAALAMRKGVRLALRAALGTGVADGE